MSKTLIDDRYELGGRVGGGGMADVFLAHDEVLDRDVALKLLKARYAGDEEFVERFRREARNAAALSHPNIVPIFDRGESEDGAYYIAMEYLPGGTLEDRMPERGVLPVRTAAVVALQVAEALQVAHERGVVHRDIKPRNVLFAGTGDVKVADFGIARAADATTISDLGAILGAAKYMSPEQAQGRPVGPRSDLYSLGVVLYEMLTGTFPFEVEDPADVHARHAQGPPRRPSETNPEVPGDVDALVVRLLATDPTDRYGSAAELVEELKWARDGWPPVAGSSSGEATTVALAGPAPASLLPAAGGAGSPRGRKRRRLSRVLAALAMLVALLGGAGWDVWRDPGGVPGVLEGVLGGLREGADRALAGPGEVPAVEGLVEQEARGRLAEAGFGVEVRLRESTEEDAGRVLEQSIPGGERAGRGSEILLAVGEGQRAARVPDLVGLSYPEADDALEEAGFLLGGVEEVASDAAPAGVIMDQDPPPGATLDPGSYVYLTTSVGSPSSGQEPDATSEK